VEQQRIHEDDSNCAARGMTKTLCGTAELEVAIDSL